MMTREEIDNLLNKTNVAITEADLNKVKQSIKEAWNEYIYLQSLYEALFKVKVLNRALRRQRNNE